MMSAVHLSAMRSKTRREGQWGSRTDPLVDAFGMPFSIAACVIRKSTGYIPKETGDWLRSARLPETARLFFSCLPAFLSKSSSLFPDEPADRLMGRDGARPSCDRFVG